MHDVIVKNLVAACCPFMQSPSVLDDVHFVSVARLMEEFATIDFSIEFERFRIVV